jgi:hypothetical protein
MRELINNRRVGLKAFLLWLALPFLLAAAAKGAFGLSFWALTRSP